MTVRGTSEIVFGIPYGTFLDHSGRFKGGGGGGLGVAQLGGGEILLALSLLGNILHVAFFL